MHDHLEWGQDLKTSLSKLANDGSVGLLDHYILTILTNVRKTITLVITYSHETYQPQCCSSHSIRFLPSLFFVLHTWLLRAVLSYILHSFFLLPS